MEPCTARQRRRIRLLAQEARGGNRVHHLLRGQLHRDRWEAYSESEANGFTLRDYDPRGPERSSHIRPGGAVRERLQARNNPKNGACLAQNLTLNIMLIIGH